MTFFCWLAIVVLKLLLIGGLVRAAMGPTPSDRISATLLLGTTGTAMLLLLSKAMQAPVLVDAALVLVLLAVIASVAFARFAAHPTRTAERTSNAA